MNATSPNPSAASLVQAVRGPIMLISLGALVEIDYMGIYGFSRTWPVLIIIFGLLKLLERVVASPSYGNNPSPPGGSAI